MASGHAARQWLEALKFSVYVVTPIAATVYLGTGAYPYLERMIHNTSYIVYPPEGEAPPNLHGKCSESEKKREQESNRTRPNLRHRSDICA
ncbi:hypothetical protein BWQ96_01136 [Gracilariopsis chorda]|uniref:Uncharacterized protein n=1 Tax=Gracilariopsis chorda TaxID=448386 RepID=A0A2V3J3L2_9FLOR|nr:hypothetical protein BWQ96_01136 [Gracilariopsis chorda]|eukprot:PXF48998.1 hypothetical protein BWQ96_01136 [Gracilariopsis chorda]